MATAVIQTATKSRTGYSRSIRHLVLAWLLMLPLIFFAVHGNFSFLGAGNSSLINASMSGLTSSGRNVGFVGYIVIPGIAYSIVLWLLLINGKRVVTQALQMKMLTFLALFTICSALWSQDPFRSAYNGFFYLIETLFAFYLVLKFDPEEILSIMMMTGLSISILSIITVFLFPQYGVMQSARDGVAWIGVFADRTSTGKCMLYLLSPAIIFRRRSLQLSPHDLYLAMSIMVFMAHAATARVILLLYIALMASMTCLPQVRTAIFAAYGWYIPCGRGFDRGCGPSIPASDSWGSRPERHPVWPHRDLAPRSRINCQATASGIRILFLLAGFKRGVGEYHRRSPLDVWLCAQRDPGNLPATWSCGYGPLLRHLISGDWERLVLSSQWLPSWRQWYIGIIALTIVYNIDESTVLWPIDIVSIMYVVACCGLAKAVRQIKSIRTLEAMNN